MTVNTFTDLSYDELKKARDQIDDLMQERRDAALAEFKAKAETMAIDLSSVLGAMDGKAKYSDGNGNTWSGRGRKPAWVLEAEGQGKTLDDLRV
jgi:DNA-binding protein H-NS